jgi:hypothetical protein
MEMNREHCWNDTDRVKRSTQSKTCPSATWSAINLTRNGLVSNPNLRGDRPATNRLNHGRSLVHKIVTLFPVSRGGHNREYQNMNYELNYVLLTIRTVATHMNVIGKYCGTFLDAIRILLTALI